MNKLWYKSWLEARLRFQIALMTLLPIACLAYAMVEQALRKQAADASLVMSEFLWPRYLGSILVLVAPFMAMILAGSGLNTQTAYGMTRGFHGSMLFTLSLPVRRRDLLRTRATLGLAGYALFLVLTIGCLPVVAALKGVSISGATVHWGYVALVSLLTYSLALLPTALLDEFWGSMVGFGVVAFIWGLLVGMDIFRRLDLTGIHSAWHPAAITAAVIISLACWLAAAWAVERAEV